MGISSETLPAESEHPEMSKEAMSAAIGDLEDLLKKVGTFVDTDFENHKRDIVDLRRAISEKHGQIFSLATTAFDNVTVLHRFRVECYRMRAATARHQADWPVVMIDPTSAAYIRSLKPMREANLKFLDWVKDALAGDRRSIEA